LQNEAKNATNAKSLLVSRQDKEEEVFFNRNLSSAPKREVNLEVIFCIATATESTVN